MLCMPSRVAFSSVTARVARYAPAPVIVVRAH
jgi:nucleotide-binding universal stress UspA family protein